MGEEALLDSPDAESGLKTSDEERKSLLVSFLSILISIPALIGA